MNWQQFFLAQNVPTFTWFYAKRPNLLFLGVERPYISNFWCETSFWPFYPSIEIKQTQKKGKIKNKLQLWVQIFKKVQISHKYEKIINL